MKDFNFNLLRNALKPKGSEPIIRLDFDSNYFQDEFVYALIDELERKYMLGLDQISKTDILSMCILLDSAGINLTKGNDESANS